MTDTVKETTEKPRRHKLPPGPGRPKGMPNKATVNAREAIARFVDANSERVQGWLDLIEEQDGPQAAYRCFLDLVEYHVPKLARTEVTGANGGPMAVSVVPTDQKL